jgi:hypothetical protein
MTTSDEGTAPTPAAPAPPAGAAPENGAGRPEAGAAATPARGASAAEPILPTQSREDTDAAWGEYPEPADDRLYRDRPPHWDDL